jgi:hypothetical protein
MSILPNNKKFKKTESSGMKKLLNNADGYVHHLVFILIIVGIVGLLVFSGRRVWVSTNNEKKAKIAASVQNDSHDGGNDETSTPQTKPVVVSKKSSAAAAVTQTASAPPAAESVVVTSPYVLDSPEGSFNQLIKELKNGNFKNALYFITPSFMEKTAELLKANQYVTLEQCTANEFCSKLLNTPVDELEASAISIYNGTNVSVEGKSIVFNVAFDGDSYVSHTTEVSGDYKIKVNMVDAGDHWLVDGITFNDYSI